MTGSEFIRVIIKYDHQKSILTTKKNIDQQQW